MIGSYYLVRDLVVSSGAILGAYCVETRAGTDFLEPLPRNSWNDFYVETIRLSDNRL